MRFPRLNKLYRVQIKITAHNSFAVKAADHGHFEGITSRSHISIDAIKLRNVETQTDDMRQKPYQYVSKEIIYNRLELNEPNCLARVYKGNCMC